MTTATALRTFTHRIGYLTSCVMPADILSAESIDAEDTSNLRTDASQDGLSYFQVMRSLPDGLYLARVAASPDRVAQGYTVLLTEQDLYAALPWDHRLSRFLADPQNAQPERILDLLHAHAAEIQPVRRVSAEEAGVTTAPAPAATSLTPLDTVEVCHNDVQDALARVAKSTVANRRTSQFHLQQALLSAMIDTLMGQLYQAQEQAQALTIKARCLLIAQIQRWHRHTQERVVNAVAHFSPEHQQVLWRLTVGFPA